VIVEGSTLFSSGLIHMLIIGGIISWIISFKYAFDHRWHAEQRTPEKELAALQLGAVFFGWCLPFIVLIVSAIQWTIEKLRILFS
jgi:hypothetical protein